jgi:hypothetical protein
VKHVLEHLASSTSQKKSHLMVASHNENSIRLAAQLMKDFDIKPNEDKVSFGQIYGMGDYLSTPLGKLQFTQMSNVLLLTSCNQSEILLVACMII